MTSAPAFSMLGSDCSPILLTELDATGAATDNDGVLPWETTVLLERECSWNSSGDVLVSPCIVCAAFTVTNGDSTGIELRGCDRRFRHHDWC